MIVYSDKRKKRDWNERQDKEEQRADQIINQMMLKMRWTLYCVFFPWLPEWVCHRLLCIGWDGDLPKEKVTHLRKPFPGYPRQVCYLGFHYPHWRTYKGIILESGNYITREQLDHLQHPKSTQNRREMIILPLVLLMHLFFSQRQQMGEKRFL